MSIGPVSAFANQLHATKCRGEGEDFTEWSNRVAGALAEDDTHFQRFREALRKQSLLPAGRVQSGAGSLKTITMHNCFVSGTIADSFVAGPGNIMQRATEAAATMRMGGGIGYDFSSLRPKGAEIKKLGSQSSGPVSFMDIFDSVCRCVASSGHRRGAQMGVMRIDHPDIEEFIHAKQNHNRLSGFNISAAVTDEFMEALAADETFDLKFEGQVYETVSAANLWNMLMRSTHDWADPGILFIDTINRNNNLEYCETIAASNPCGEQPLPPHGACLLGSVNLTKYVTPGNRNRGWSMIQLEQDVADFVWALDNVTDKGVYALPEQRAEALNKRRMGIGVTGLANAVEFLAGRACYGEEDFLQHQSYVMSRIRDVAYETSVDIAAKKGSFPMLDVEQYLAGEFIQTLNPGTRQRIEKTGIRNSHLLSVAPTGTVSLYADNVSSGAEPVFSYATDRKYQTFDGEQTERLYDYGVKFLGTEGKTCDQVTVDEHLAVLATATKYVDSAVSKTCNLPNDIAWEDFKSVYVKAWELGCKGCTTYRAGGKREAILTAVKEEPEVEDGKACFIDPVTGRSECG